MHIHNQKHRHPRMSFFCRLLSLLYFCLALPLVLPSSLPPSSSSCRQLSTQAGQDPRGGFRPLQMQQEQQQQQSLERARRQQQQQAARQQERQQQQQQQQQQDGPPQKRARAGNNFNCGPAMERHIKETRGKIDRGGEQAFRDLPGIQFSRWIVLPPNPALRRPGGDPAVPQPPDRGAFQLQKLGVYLPEYIFGHMPHCPHCRSFEHVSAIGWTGKPRRVIGLSSHWYLDTKRYRCRGGEAGPGGVICRRRTVASGHTSLGERPASHTCSRCLVWRSRLRRFLRRGIMTMSGSWSSVSMGTVATRTKLTTSRI